MAAKPIVKVDHRGRNPDQILLIQQARERLRANPDEALKWYNRANSPGRRGRRRLDDPPYREDVLAVWEYLERTIPLQTSCGFREKR